MRNIALPQGLTGKDAIGWIVANKRLLMTAKKAELKRADAVSFVGNLVNRSGEAVKGANPVVKDDNSIKNSTVINTCLWYDSHGDVHLPGIWKRSLQDNAKKAVNDVMLLQEHLMKFDKIIADGSDVIPYTKTMSWRELGVDYDGDTEALIFDNNISADRNPFMFKQYKDGRVKNHSVGMYYMDIALAVGYKHKDYKEENDLWDKWIDKIANKEEAIEDGMFWAVAQAKVIEGSAVPKGSNVVTPTLNTSDKSTYYQPDQSTEDKPQAKDVFGIINNIYN